MMTEPQRVASSYQPAIGDPVLIVREGAVVRRSRNLRGLITHAHKAGVLYASLWAVEHGEAMAYVTFRDGSWCRVRFASFIVCRNFFRSRWRRWGLYAEVRNSDTSWSFI